MAHINPPQIGRRRDDPTTVRQPEPDERRTALAVLLTGRPTPDDPAVDHFIGFTERQGMNLGGLWAKYKDQTPVSAVLIIPTPGRAAVVFISPIFSRRHVESTSELMAAAIRAQDPGRMSLIQSLQDPSQRFERDALIQAGFSRLASLVYMRWGRTSRPTTAEAGKIVVKPGPVPGHSEPFEIDGRALTVFGWQEDRFELFAREIQANYKDTLDCPGLVGIRRIEDIIAGHKAVGRFDAGLWSAFYLDDRPVGVMLLNPLVDQPELELVYLGITPSFRGKGLASRLMRHAALVAEARNYSGIHLAVDEQNTPAVRLYHGLGYRATGRKVAMIYTLSQSDL